MKSYSWELTVIIVTRVAVLPQVTVVTVATEKTVEQKRLNIEYDRVSDWGWMLGARCH